MQRKLVPDVVRDQQIHSVTPDVTARTVAQTMAENRVAAVVVVENGVLKGIITERDITARLVARNRDPDTTIAADIMTPNPDTLGPEDSAVEALRMMRERNYRHLPVTDQGTVVGMISVRDLYAVVTDQLTQDVRTHEAFIYGESYGTA
ncbi:MAG: CBS domain-containing protein [Rhodospirillum sp.]|nr:CBS domain-containing protein [Rhodospirillum sp.]MCF8488886.1 CBS domain-containing protein [Rhodospirillum sp.]MCF8500052.1 CBS domain-containing protein [Rhodospirillum sp.]